MQKIQLKGTPKEQGRHHGENFKNHIQELFEIRNNLIEKVFAHTPKEKIELFLTEQVDFLKKFPRSFAEFTGIAEGSGLTLNQIMALNNYTDFRDFIHNGDLGGCSLLAIRNQTQVLSGQTWDMHASATPYIIHIECLEPVKHHILTVVGGMALAGVNEHGLSIFINNMHCNETRIGLMWGALVKEMLLKTSAKEALAFLKGNFPCSGHNYMICDLNDSINIETTGTRSEITYDSSKPGVTFHTNHYVSLLRETEVLAKQSKTTHQRYDELQKYFDRKSIEDHNFKSIVNDIFKGQETSSICIQKPENPNDPMTCGGLICDLKARKGEIFSGLYTDGDVHSIQW